MPGLSQTPTTTEPYTIRPGMPADALPVIEVHRAAVRGTITHYSSALIADWAPHDISPERVDRLAQTILSGNVVMLVALNSANIVIGFGSIVPTKDELRALYVRPDHTRRGVGSAILRRLEVLARKCGSQELRMNASLNATAFYTAVGFTSLGPGQHQLSSRMAVPCVRMRKRL